jgi:hypothetical protein
MNILNIRIELTNPFDRWDYFNNLGCISGMITRFKAWELEHSYYSPLLFDFEMRWNRKCDHAGFECGIGLLGYGVHFRIYDTRHWDEYDNCWKIYPTDHYYEYTQTDR